MVDITKQMDDLKRQTYIQFKSYDELIMLAKQNEQNYFAYHHTTIYNKDLTRGIRLRNAH